MSRTYQFVSDNELFATKTRLWNQIQSLVQSHNAILVPPIRRELRRVNRELRRRGWVK
jgi:hypothetical protein